jgi:branched-chain amino acid transport system substrate-binding protein
MAEKTNNGLLWAIGIVLILLGSIYFYYSDNIVGNLRIGVITPISAEEGISMTELQQTYNLAVLEINDKGGVKGRTVELVYMDGTCGTADVTAAAQKLINTHKVDYIIGGTCEAETRMIAQVTQNARALLISSMLAGTALSDAGDLVYRTYPATDSEGALIASHGFGTEQSRAAVISEETEYSQGVRAAFVDNYEGEIVFDGIYDSENTTLWSFMRDLRNANPQMVYLIPDNADNGAVLLKQIKLAYLNVAIYGAQSMLDTEAFEANKSLYEELVFAGLQLSEEGKAAEMLTAFEETYGALPTDEVHSAAAYDSIYLIKDALESGARGAEGVAEYFDASINGWDGAIGALSFDDNGDAEVDLNLMQVIGGELVEIAR